jgi:hypothetical protein
MKTYRLTSIEETVYYIDAENAEEATWVYLEDKATCDHCTQIDLVVETVDEVAE